MSEPSFAPTDKKPTTDASPDPVKDELDVVTESFHWVHEAAGIGIDAMKGVLKQNDEPDWIEQLLAATLELAVPAGLAGVGVAISKKLVADGEATQELVKVMFEGGATKGIEKGKSIFASANKDEVIDSFVDAHKQAVLQAHSENQQRWIRQGRHRIKSLTEAQQLAKACSQDNVKTAARQHAASTRDAWVSYLAQTVYGARKLNGGAVTKDTVHDGPVTTNMSNQESRDRTNKHAPGFVPDAAPSYERTMSGKDMGVLGVAAQLPAFNPFTYQLTGKPVVMIAGLNGVNSKVREQYANRPLSECHIPRQVTAHVEGAPNFVLNIDERGETVLPRANEREWLENRALVGNPRNAAKSKYDRYLEGTKLLLEELVPAEILKRDK